MNNNERFVNKKFTMNEIWELRNEIKVGSFNGSCFRNTFRVENVFVELMYDKFIEYANRIATSNNMSYDESITLIDIPFCWYEAYKDSIKMFYFCN